MDDQNLAKENLGMNKEVKKPCLTKFFEAMIGSYCALTSDKASDHVITDSEANIRAFLFQPSNVAPVITACLPILTEACKLLQISDLALLTSANPTIENP